MNATAVANKAQHALTFGSHEIKTIARNGQIWMSAEELGRALEYANPAISVTRLYNRAADEFTATMTKVIKVMTAGGKQAVRFFSLRGAHLLAMFARTDKAKAFRTWVLDILDREVADLQAQAAKGERLDHETKANIQELCGHVEHLRSWWQRFAPGIRALNDRVAGNVHDHFTHGAMTARLLVKELGLRSEYEYAASYPWGSDYTERNRYFLKNKSGVAA